MKYKSGMPIGGIGSGKLEIFPDGSFRNFTINNNIDTPVEFVPGTFFAVACDIGDRQIKRDLLDDSRYAMCGVERVEYDARLPHANLRFIDGALPVDINLTAFSPLIPYNIKDSSLPAALFKLSVKNISGQKIGFCAALSWQNIINCGGSVLGDWAMVQLPPTLQKERGKYYIWRSFSGNYQKQVDVGGNIGLYFDSEEKPTELSYGNYTLLAKGEGMSVTTLPCWNTLLTSDFHQALSVRGFAAGANQANQKGETGKYEPAGAVALSGEIEAGQSKELIFVAAWFTPGLYAWYLPEMGKLYGHYYENFFASSTDVAKYALDNFDRLFSDSKELIDTINRSSLPEWVKEKLLNDMFPVLSCSWLIKDGRFSISESPTAMGGCFGTIDQRTASHTIYTALWPELDKIELDMFRKTQTEEGGIAHDVGWSDLESDKKPSAWVDLPSSYILETYHHYLWTGDEAFIEKMYPSMKKAVAYLCSPKADIDQDGLPDAQNGTTYDAYHWRGACAFVGTLWLAALKAMQKLADKYVDSEFGKQCDKAYEKAASAMMARLWMGDYFRLYNDDKTSGEVSDLVSSGQLAGQWLAYLLGLGELFDKQTTQKCLQKIYDYCLKLVPYAVADCMGLNGVIGAGFNGWKCSWVPYVEAYMAATAFYAGMPEIGMETFRRCRDVTYEQDRRPWEAYLAYSVYSGEAIWGRWYMTAPASWAVLWAMQGYGYSLPEKRIWVAPKLTDKTQSMSAPLFGAAFWIWCDFSKSEKGAYLFLDVIKVIDEAKFNRLETEVEFAPSKVTVNGKDADFEYDEESGKLYINSDIDVAKGKKYDIEISY